MKRKWDSELKDLYINIDSGIYYVRYWSPKLHREIERSLRTTVRAQAIRARKSVLEEIPDMKDHEAIKYKTLNQVIDAWLDQKVIRAEATKLVIKNQIENKIRPYFGEYDPERVDNVIWKKYVTKVQQANSDASTFNTRKYLSEILRFASDQGIIRKRVHLEDFDDEREAVGRIVTPSEIKTLLEKAIDQNVHDMILISSEMAMRWSEIRLLSWDRINFETDVIHLRKQDTKTRKARSPVMTKAVREVLLKRKARSLGPFVFASPHNPKELISKSDKNWQLTKEEACINCRFHDLRHTALTRLFKASNRYAEICEYAGLSVREALKTYVKFTRDDMRAIAELSG